MFSPILLQATAPQGNSMFTFIFPLLMIAVLYFFMLRPQMKRQKEAQKFVDSLHEGMEVFTNAGIIGRITKIDGNAVRLMIDEKTFMRVLKNTIAGEYKG